VSEATATIPDGSSWPRVTVVTPSYNQSSFLEATIRSVLAQNYPNLEYIIIDGGSADGSIDIIKRYEPFLAHWVSESDRGQSHAINKGWQRSSGDILAFLNSDDLYLPGAIRASVGRLIREPQVDLVYGRAKVFDDTGVLYETRPPRHDVRELLVCNYIQQPTVFVRRDLVDRIGLFDEHLHYCFDYDYWMRAAAMANFGRLRAATAGVRLHAASKTGCRQSAFARERIAIHDRTFRPGFPWSADLDLRRKAYARDLLCAIGLFSGFSVDERRDALFRLRALEPAPSVNELSRVVADWDTEISDGSTATARAAGQSLDSVPVDPLGILPSLQAEGLLTQEDASQVEHGAQIYRNLRNAVRHRSSPQAVRRLITMTCRNPPLLATRAWWGWLARSCSRSSAWPPVYHAACGTGRDLWRRRGVVRGHA
jgi:glycosyltransferase involved in cell wall biosynthesis